MEVLRRPYRNHRVLLSPHDQGWNFQTSDTLVEPLSSVRQVLQKIVDGVSIAAFEMLLVGEINQAVGRQALVIEQELEDFAQMLAGGNTQVDGQFNRISPQTSGIDQNKFVDCRRKVQREGCGDPAAQRTSD